MGRDADWYHTEDNPGLGQDFTLFTRSNGYTGAHKYLYPINLQSPEGNSNYHRMCIDGNYTYDHFVTLHATNAAQHKHPFLSLLGQT